MSHATAAPARPTSQLTIVKLGAFTIFAAGLAVSYMHIVELAEAFGESGWRAWAIAGTVDTLIILAVYAGRAARSAGQDPAPAVRWALSAGIAATIVGNVHHGLRANLPEGVFARGLLRPDIDALGVATVGAGILVALWAPAAVELAYRVLLWAQDQDARQHTAEEVEHVQAAEDLQMVAEAPATAADDDRPDPDPEPNPPRGGERRRPISGPDSGVDGRVVELYRKQRAAGQQPSERVLAKLASDEIGELVTRHQARKAIAAARLASGQHRRPNPAPAEAGLAAV